MLKKQTQWFSTSSFADAVGHFGSAPNGVLLSPGIELWDLSAIKNIRFGDRATFQFRGEFFNAFNHTNFGQPSLSGGGIGTNTDSSNFGQVTAAHTPAKSSLEASCTSNGRVHFDPSILNVPVLFASMGAGPRRFSEVEGQEGVKKSANVHIQLLLRIRFILYSAGMSNMPAPALPRLASIDRSQLLLHTVDVERMIDEDHSARSIWHLVGRLSLSLYYAKIAALEGRAGRDHTAPQLLISLCYTPTAKGLAQHVKLHANVHLSLDSRGFAVGANQPSNSIGVPV